MNESELTESETQKRKREELSSISSISEAETPEKKKQQKKKSKKESKDKKKESKDSNKDSKKEETKEEDMESAEAKKHLAEINEKLSNMLTKNDPTLKTLIKEAVTSMKDELLKNVNERIDKLETRLFEKEKENDDLKAKISSLTESLNKQLEINVTAKKEMLEQKQEADGKINDLEQYSRRNNIRISGLPETEKENEIKTTENVIKTLNEKIPNLNLKMEDIDISHRLGVYDDTSKDERPVIVKFVSRMTRDKVIRERKKFDETPVFLNEDLTKINKHVLYCLRKKLPDEVDGAWSRSGNLFFRNKMGTVHQVKYRQYERWINLPWPARAEDE